MPMKRSFAALAAVLFMFSCNQDKNITITGSYPAGAGEYLRIEMLNIAQTQFIDSVKVTRKGSFTIGLDLENPELILLKNPRGQYINLLAFPEDHIQLEIPDTSFLAGYTVSGSQESEKIRLLVEKVEATKVVLDSILDELNQLEDMNSPEATELIADYREVFDQQKKSNIKFVIENLSSLASVYALYQRVAPDLYLLNEVRDLQFYKIVSDSLKVKFPGSTLTQSLVNDVDKRMAEYNNILMINKLTELDKVETGLVELKIEDPLGNERSLRELNGKVVLLNFWASWDRESRDATRRLINIYNKYHARGFEIYSVALENNRNTWRSAIDFEEFPWINVSELTYPISYAARLYNVTELPTTFLIDREGNIGAKNIYGNQLATWLDNLL